jgi:deoxyribose-phosphate aldolase
LIVKGGNVESPDYKYEEIAKMIDHSLLNPSLTTTEVRNGVCGEIDVDWVKPSTGYAASGATMKT